MHKKEILIIIMVIMLIGQPACDTIPIDPNEISTVYSNEISTLNYLITSVGNEVGLAANLVDTLIEYDQYGSVQPALAMDWSVSEDGLTWTFNLRQGVHWYTWDGEEYAEVTAQDFVGSMEYILNPDNASSTANIVYRVIENASDYYHGLITDFSQVGVKARDRYTLEYTLKSPVPYFLSMLNYVCFFPVNGQFLEEAGDKFGTDNKHILYNGAYILEVFEHQNRRIMMKNPNYWDRDKVYVQRVYSQYNSQAAALAPEMFLRNEISFAIIPSAYLDEWMNDPVKKELVRPGRPGFFTYFYAFNFDPRYDKIHQPDNWKVAVNNINFRKSIFHAFDRIAALLTTDPYYPENRLTNTITPPNFVMTQGQDYTQLGSLKEISNGDSFDKELALQYKEKAIEELKGEVSFPVKIVMPYNSSSSDWVNRVQVIQQQLHRVLGEDYVQVVVDPHPPTGFLANTRRAGKYSLQEVNWGPDYGDPETYTDPFKPGASFNSPELITETDENGNNLYEVYQWLLEKAINETQDIDRRYHLFAEAEAFLIDKAVVIPYSLGGVGYFASNVDPFGASWSPFGVSSDRFKGRKILEEPLSLEEYKERLRKWESERKGNYN